MIDPRTQAALDAADRHARFARELMEAMAFDDDARHTWVLVAAFYAAVHYVNAWLWERQREEPRTHRERDALLREQPRLQPMKRAFRQLHNWSTAARYDPWFRADVIAARVALDRLQRVSEPITGDLR